MNVIEPYVEVVKDDFDSLLRKIEWCGRKCYKSEHLISSDSAPGFVDRILHRGHESVIEHSVITAGFIVDRGVSHEIVRHRLAAYSQESTRYCNYSKDSFGNEITVIKPFFFPGDYRDGGNIYYWQEACERTEEYYFKLLANGATPQEARSVLPNSLKTDIATTYNLREWRHFFTLRCSPAAHPQMRQVAIPLLKYFKNRLPVVFGDIPYDEAFPEEFEAKVYEVSL